MTLTKTTSRLMGALAVALLLSLGLAGPASATEASGADTDGSTDTTSDIVAALEAAGVDAESIPQELIDKVNARIDEMIDAGVLTDEQVQHIEDLREAGDLEARITERIVDKRVERTEQRQAIRGRLAEAGVEVADGQSVKDALTEAGFDKDEAKELMKSIRPKHRGDGEDEGGADADVDPAIDEQIDSIIDKALERNRGRSAEAHERNAEPKDGPRTGLGPRDGDTSNGADKAEKRRDDKAEERRAAKRGESGSTEDGDGEVEKPTISPTTTSPTTTSTTSTTTTTVAPETGDGTMPDGSTDSTTTTTTTTTTAPGSVDGSTGGA